MRIILVLLMLLSGPVQAQNKLVDSLLAELPKAKSDSARVAINSKLSKQYLLSDARKAKEYAQAAERLAIAIGSLSGRAKALNLLGNAHLVMGEYDQAMDCHYTSLQMSEQLGDTSSLIASHISLGNVYYKIKDPTRALNNYLLASELANKVQNELAMSKVHNNVGNLYEEKGEYAKALGYFRRAAAIQEKLGDKKSWAISLHNIGNIHLYLGQPEKGLPYLFQSVRLNEEIQNDMIRMASLGKIAGIYHAIGNNREALNYARRSYDMAVKIESSKKIAEAAQLMHTIYASEKDYEQAYNYLAVLNKHQEILTAETRTKVTAELTAKYESEQKELENKHLKAESEKKEIEIKHQQGTLLLEGTVILLLLVLLTVLYINRQRLKGAHTGLQEAHDLMQRQHSEIIAQKNEINSQASALREQNEQLEQHSVFKNKVFSIVSHDLRSPFSSIKGLLNLTQRRTFSESEVKHFFGLLGKEMEVAIGMLDNLLVWAKTQLQESGVALQPVDLYRLSEENIQLAKSQAESKGIRLVNNIGEGAVALADRERLNFVLRNLLMNAVKFSFPGGEVRLQVQEREAQTIVSVSDDGKGISPGNISKLFADTRFTTLGTSQEKGTGLGLMLCKELAESFNGSISVASEEGKGSVFSVALPKAVLQMPAHERQGEPELVF